MERVARRVELGILMKYWEFPIAVLVAADPAMLTVQLQDAIESETAIESAVVESVNVFPESLNFVVIECQKAATIVVADRVVQDDRAVQRGDR